MARLAAKRIPVVTLVTDLPSSQRVAYVGIDNRAAGATAAYLVGQWLGDRRGGVLVTISRGFFRGEEEREMGFRAADPRRRPRSAPLSTSPRATASTTPSVTSSATPCSATRTSRAVYSIGGGNRATWTRSTRCGRDYAVFVAHDLDHDNIRLLRERRLSAVLHHDLRQDVRRACQIVMRAHRALPDAGQCRPSAIQVVTPYNMPPGAGAVPAGG